MSSVKFKGVLFIFITMKKIYEKITDYSRSHLIQKNLGGLVSG